SGIVGLICAALGVARDDDDKVARLGVSLRMGVRVEREGVVSNDYHTAGGGRWPGRDKYGVVKADGAAMDTVVSNRYYLADADFLVGLEGERGVLEGIAAALGDPHWPLYLGRKSFVPSRRVLESEALLEDSLESALRSHPWRVPKRGEPPSRLRLVLECSAEEGAARMDQPLSFQSNARRHGSRYVRISWVGTATLPKTEALP
ncbi:MAG: type I-E CRISPR-associated protein Cas5/CasD, partial [bacterium]